MATQEGTNVNVEISLIDKILKEKLKLGVILTEDDQRVFDDIKLRIQQNIMLDFFENVCRIPETSSIQEDINTCGDRRISYGPMNPLTFDKLPSHIKTLFHKYHCSCEIDEIFKILFSKLNNRYIPDPVVFDGILILYYNRPLAFFNNVEDDKKFEYCICIDITNYRSILYQRVRTEIERILIKRNLELLHQEQEKNAQKQDIGLYVTGIISIILTIGVVFVLKQKM